MELGFSLLSVRLVQTSSTFARAQVKRSTVAFECLVTVRHHGHRRIGARRSRLSGQSFATLPVIHAVILVIGRLVVAHFFLLVYVRA